MATFTIEQINKLNATKKGVRNQLYQCDNGDVFFGTSAGALMLAQNASTTPYTPSTPSSGTGSIGTIGEAINILNAEVALLPTRDQVLKYVSFRG